MSELIAIKNWLAKPAPTNSACGCLGAQKIEGRNEREPCCPCRMKYIEVVDNEYFEVDPYIDLSKPFLIGARHIGMVGGPYNFDSKFVEVDSAEV